MKKKWPFIKIKDYPLTIIDGDRGTNYPAKEDFLEMGFCVFLNTGNVTARGFEFNNCSFITEKKHKQLRKGLLERNDIILTTRGTIGNIAFYADSVEYSCVRINSGMVILRPDQNKLSPSFLYHLMKSDVFQEQALSFRYGAAQPQLPIATLKHIELPLPKKDQQQKIAAILSAYDDLIENNLKRIKLLEEMAQITYEEWFVRLKFPGHETTPMDSKTGLPTGWKRILLEQACDVSGGGTPSTEIDEYWEGGDIAWFSPTDLSKNNSLVLLDSSQKITHKGLQKSSAKLMQPNSFMMTSRATIGLFGLIDKPFCTNQGFINVTPKSTFHKHFLLFNFKLRVPEFLNYASGATFLEISKSKFKKLKIDWPTSDLLEKWDEVSTPIIQELTNLSKQNQLLKEARDILLPRLMTGMIDVERLELPNTLQVEDVTCDEIN